MSDISDFELLSGNSSPQSLASCSSLVATMVLPSSSDNLHSLPAAAAGSNAGTLTAGAFNVSSLEMTPTGATAPSAAAGSSGHRTASGFMFSPKLTMRPMTTHVNFLVAGGSFLGKSTFIKACTTLSAGGAVGPLRLGVPSFKPLSAAAPCPATAAANAAATTCAAPAASSPSSASSTKMQATPSASAASDSTSGQEPSSSPDNPPAVFTADPAAWRTPLKPILVPDTFREMVYTFQDSPGCGSTLDPAGYLKSLITHLFKQQAQDYNQLRGSGLSLGGMHKYGVKMRLPLSSIDSREARGDPRSLACGCLQHSTTACIYFLPPHGPSKLDLVLMSALSGHVALIPVIGKADAMTQEEGQACRELVRDMLVRPDAYVPGLAPIHTFRFTHAADPCGSLLPVLVHTRTAPPTSPGCAPAAPGLLELIQLLCGDEVYGLLDHAWDLFGSFCSSYEAAHTNLSSLVARGCGVEPFLACPATCSEQRARGVATRVASSSSAGSDSATIYLNIFGPACMTFCASLIRNWGVELCRTFSLNAFLTFLAIIRSVALRAGSWHRPRTPE